MIYQSVEIFPWHFCYLLVFYRFSEVSALTVQDYRLYSIKESHLTVKVLKEKNRSVQER